MHLVSIKTICCLGKGSKYRIEPKVEKALELFKALHSSLQDTVLLILESMLRAEQDISKNNDKDESGE